MEAYYFHHFLSLESACVSMIDVEKVDSSLHYCSKIFVSLSMQECRSFFELTAASI